MDLEEREGGEKDWEEWREGKLKLGYNVWDKNKIKSSVKVQQSYVCTYAILTKVQSKRGSYSFGLVLFMVISFILLLP